MGGAQSDNQRPMKGELGETEEEARETRQNKKEKQNRVSNRNRLLFLMEQWRVWTNTNNKYN